MNSINKTGQDVQAKHPADNTIANNQAGPESIIHQPNGATNTSLKPGKLLLAKELKELVSLKELMESDRHQFRTSGRYSMCCCPFHADKTPSFSIREDDDSTGKCFGCDWYGDIIKYEMEFHKVDFRTAWARLNDFYYKCPRRGRKAKACARVVRPETIELSDSQKAERKKYAQRLAIDRWIAEEVCRKRYEKSGEQWNPDTIQKLAVEGSLGWAGDALAFIYPTGTKYRKWPGREFTWDCEVTSLWRGNSIARATHIYLTESETDAIALVDGGAEKNQGNVVVAVPSANSFNPEWAPLFIGKVVILCFDNDDAGERGAIKIAPLLKPYAKQLRMVDLQEVA